MALIASSPRPPAAGAGRRLPASAGAEALGSVVSIAVGLTDDALEID